MKYLYLLLSFILIGVTVLWSSWLAPTLVHDLKIRDKTLFRTTEYEIAREHCRSLLKITICQFVVRHRFETSINKRFDYLLFGNIEGRQVKVLRTREQHLTLNIGRSLIKNRLVSFAVSITMFLILILAFLLWLRPNRPKRRVSSQPAEYSEAYLQKLAKKVKVPEDPVEVWKSILGDADLRWVVFRGGTLVLCEDEQYPYENAAWSMIDQYAQPAIGAHMGDYSIYLNKENAVWVVSYPDSSVFNYIKVSECTLETVAGLVAREVRAQDAYEKQILYIEQGAPVFS